MRIGPIGLMVPVVGPDGERTGAWNLLSLHWHRSITWRFIVAWVPARNLKRVRRGFAWHRNTMHLLAHVDLGIFGRLSLHTQRNMWRDSVMLTKGYLLTGHCRPCETQDPGYRKRQIDEDICPECGGELDTGWECNACGYDAMPDAYTELDFERERRR